MEAEKFIFDRNLAVQGIALMMVIVTQNFSLKSVETVN